MLPRYLATHGGITYLEIPLPESEGIRTFSPDKIKEKFNLFVIWHMFSFVNDNLDWIRYTTPMDYGDIKVFNKDVKKVYISGLTSLGDAYKPNVDAIKINSCFDDEIMLKAHYVDYYLYIEDGNCDFTSIYLCSELKDTFIQKIARYANMEHDKEFALNQILFALRSPKGRFLEGNYEEDIARYDNQKLYTVLDVMCLLMKNYMGYFRPYSAHAPFDWNVEHNMGDNYIFEGSKHTRISFSTLNWDVYRLNLSSDIRVFGTVHLDRISDKYKKYNLPATIETWAYRKFFFMRVGAVQYRKLHISATEGLIDKLKDIAIFKDSHGLYLDMSMLGIYMFNKDADLDFPYEEEYEIKCKYQALKYLQKIYAPDPIPKTVTNFKKFYNSLNEDQKLFLLENRITENGFFFKDNNVLENRNYLVVSETKRKWLEDFTYYTGDPFIKHRYLTTEQIKSFKEYVGSFSKVNIREQVKAMNDKRIEMAYKSMKRIHNKLLFTFRTDCMAGMHCMVDYLNDAGENRC